MCTQHDVPLVTARRQFLQQVLGVGTGAVALALGGIPDLGMAAAKRHRQRSEKVKAPALKVVGCSLVGAQAQALVARLSKLVASGQAEQALMQSSGDGQLDQALGMMLANMAATFAVQPGFAFYDDSSGENALATPENYLPDTDGTVLLGRNLLHNELARSAYGDMPVMAICAHEFGHIVQYGYNLQPKLNRGQPTCKRSELHADFLAGYYIGRNMERLGAAQMVEIGRAWEGLGDSDFTSPFHHGTREERLQAVEAGFKQANLPLAEAIADGARRLGA